MVSGRRPRGVHSVGNADHGFLNSLCRCSSAPVPWLSTVVATIQELTDYVGSTGTAVTITQRVIFRPGAVYT
jgi:hypothetical protein